MKNKMIYWVALCLLLLNCEENSYEFPMNECEESELQANASIQTIKDLFVFGRPVPIENDLIIEGYVVSNDKAGNFYKTISIQDHPENPTAALSISVDATNLYTKFEPGRKIFVSLKGLAIGNLFGRVQIGQLIEGELAGISSFTYKNHLSKSCELTEIIPLQVDLGELNESHLDMLISINEVQFNETILGQTYTEPGSNRSVDRKLEGYNSECEKTGSIPIRTSGFADFKNVELPEGKGKVQGVLQNYYSDLQLVLRNEDDVFLNEDRCVEKAWEPTITMSEIQEMYYGELVEFGDDEELIFGGYVISSDQEGNFKNRIILQDAKENPEVGVQVFIDLENYFETYELGEYLLVKANRLYLDKIEGILSLGFHENSKIDVIDEEEVSDFILETNEMYEVLPTMRSLKNLFENNRKGILIQLTDVQLDSLDVGKAFTFFSGDDDGFRTLMNCDSYEKIKVFTSGEASFANTTFPTGNGNLIGVLGTSLELRSAEDVLFDKPYEVCPPKIPPILISEVADPVNSVGSRFVELYNAGEQSFNLANWKLEKFNNGATVVSSGVVDLSGIVMEPNTYIVIGNTDFESVFGVQPTIVSSYISGNGDDVYRLVDSGGETIDIFGVIGEDGNGTNWEYVDGGAVRKNTVKKPSKTFNFEEWIVSSKESNFLIDYPNTPKYAPIDYFIFSE